MDGKSFVVERTAAYIDQVSVMLSGKVGGVYLSDMEKKGPPKTSVLY